MRANKALLFLSLLSVILFAFSADDAPKKLTLIVFQGSDWCPNCIRFDEHILQDDAFKTYLKKHKIEIALVDFPQKIKLSKQQQAKNDSIADRYQFDGSFPTILIARNDTLIYKELQYSNQTTAQMISQLKQKTHSL